MNMWPAGAAPPAPILDASFATDIEKGSTVSPGHSFLFLNACGASWVRSETIAVLNGWISTQFRSNDVIIIRNRHLLVEAVPLHFLVERLSRNTELLVNGPQT